MLVYMLLYTVEDHDGNPAHLFEVHDQSKPYALRTDHRLHAHRKIGSYIEIGEMGKRDGIEYLHGVTHEGEEHGDVEISFITILELFQPVCRVQVLILIPGVWVAVYPGNIGFAVRAVLVQVEFQK